MSNLHADGFVTEKTLNMLRVGYNKRKQESSNNRYADAIKRMYQDLTLQSIRMPSPGTPEEKDAFLEYSNRYMTTHPRGGPSVEILMQALQSRHYDKGVPSWANVATTEGRAIRRWLQGHLRQCGVAEAVSERKVQAVLPKMFVDELMEKAFVDGYDELAVMYHVLFHGLPRVDHLRYVTKNDVYLSAFSEDAQIFIAGLKTDGSSGTWITIPGLKPLIGPLLTGRKAYDFVFGRYSQEYLVDYLKKFAKSVNFGDGFVLGAHAFRHSGVQFLMDLGYTDDQIRRLGRWAPGSETMRLVYGAMLDPIHMLEERSRDYKCPSMGPLKGAPRKKKGGAGEDSARRLISDCRRRAVAKLEGEEHLLDLSKAPPSHVTKEVAPTTDWLARLSPSLRAAIEAKKREKTNELSTIDDAEGNGRNKLVRRCPRRARRAPPPGGKRKRHVRWMWRRSPVKRRKSAVRARTGKNIQETTTLAGDVRCECCGGRARRIVSCPKCGKKVRATCFKRDSCRLCWSQ
jgi:hypothetical protein